jgi:hypothetical protein
MLSIGIEEGFRCLINILYITISLGLGLTEPCFDLVEWVWLLLDYEFCSIFYIRGDRIWYFLVGGLGISPSPKITPHQKRTKKTAQPAIGIPVPGMVAYQVWGTYAYSLNYRYLIHSRRVPWTLNLEGITMHNGPPSWGAAWSTRQLVSIAMAESVRTVCFITFDRGTIPEASTVLIERKRGQTECRQAGRREMALHWIKNSQPVPNEFQECMLVQSHLRPK